VLLSACSKEKIHPVKGEKTSKENILIENVGTDMPSLDPQQSGDTSSGRVIADIFEGLVEYDQNSKIVPAGVSKWDVSKDGLTYTFYLRKNAKWSNGEPVTAADYVYSYQRAVTPDTLARYYADYFNPIINAKAIMAGKKSPSMLGVSAKDKYTLVIKLDKPNPTFLAALTLNVFDPINKKAVDKYGVSWAGSPKTIISNGPYILTQWVHNGYAEAIKNPYYWDKANTHIAKVRYLMIQDTSSDLQNYSAGDTGITYSALPANSTQWYKQKFPEQYHSYPVLNQTYYVFNMRKPKFKDIRVRKALSMVIDRKGLTEGVLKQGQKPSYLVVPENIANGIYKNTWKDIPGYQWVKQPLPERIKEAQKLLKAAGYDKENPLKLTINFNTSDSNRNIALVIQAIWNQVFDDAVVATVFNEDWKVYLDSLQKGNFDIARMAWVADFNEPNTYTSMYTCGNGNNYGGYCNKAADKLYYQSIQINSLKNFHQLQKQVIIKQTGDYVVIPLFTAPYNRLVQTYIKGFKPKHNVMGKHTTKELSIVQS
jgi:oligopeptide transport system substrate-binding protein